MSEHVRTVIAAVRAARRRGTYMSDATRAAIAAREGTAPEPEPVEKPKKAKKAEDAEPEPEPVEEAEG